MRHRYPRRGTIPHVGPQRRHRCQRSRSRPSPNATPLPLVSEAPPPPTISSRGPAALFFSRVVERPGGRPACHARPSAEERCGFIIGEERCFSRSAVLCACPSSPQCLRGVQLFSSPHARKHDV
ncbi:hypothetical protein MRX96_042292 [Rhipicephalus microplus]